MSPIAFTIVCVLFLLFLISAESAPEDNTCNDVDDCKISINGGKISKQQYHWRPENEHPCTIKKIVNFDQLSLHFKDGLVPALYHEPVIIRADPFRNRDFFRIVSYQNITKQFAPDFNVTLSSSNALSEHRRTILLQQYLDEVINTETIPFQPSNTSWYLFGETYTKDWQDLLNNYTLPPCTSCHDNVALSFGIGNRGSGVQWHVHGPGFSEALVGRKHWVLYPPIKNASFDKDQSSRTWMETAYPFVKPKPVECTLNPGDLIYFPDRWWHATINLDSYTAFVSTFTSEHEEHTLSLGEL